MMSTPTAGVTVSPHQARVLAPCMSYGQLRTLLNRYARQKHDNGWITLSETRRWEARSFREGLARYLRRHPRACSTRRAFAHLLDQVDEWLGTSVVERLAGLDEPTG